MNDMQFDKNNDARFEGGRSDCQRSQTNIALASDNIVCFGLTR